jgi:hypothetical protein
MCLCILEENCREDGSIQEYSKATKRKEVKKIQKRRRTGEKLKLKLYKADFAGQLSVVTDCKTVLIQLIHLGSKPLASKTCNKPFQFTLSKHF